MDHNENKRKLEASHADGAKRAKTTADKSSTDSLTALDKSSVQNGKSPDKSSSESPPPSDRAVPRTPSPHDKTPSGSPSLADLKEPHEFETPSTRAQKADSDAFNVVLDELDFLGCKLLGDDVMAPVRDDAGGRVVSYRKSTTVRNFIARLLLDSDVPRLTRLAIQDAALNRLTKRLDMEEHLKWSFQPGLYAFPDSGKTFDVATGKDQIIPEDGCPQAIVAFDGIFLEHLLDKQRVHPVLLAIAEANKWTDKEVQLVLALCAKVLARLPPSKVLPMFIGVQNSGKSSLFRLLRAALPYGELADVNLGDLEKGKVDRKKLESAWALVQPENETSFPSFATLKKYTSGGEVVEARQNYHGAKDIKLPMTFCHQNMFPAGLAAEAAISDGLSSRLLPFPMLFPAPSFSDTDILGGVGDPSKSKEMASFVVAAGVALQQVGNPMGSWSHLMTPMMKDAQSYFLDPTHWLVRLLEQGRSWETPVSAENVSEDIAAAWGIPVKVFLAILRKFCRASMIAPGMALDQMDGKLKGMLKDRGLVVCTKGFRSPVRNTRDSPFRDLLGGEDANELTDKDWIMGREGRQDIVVGHSFGHFGHPLRDLLFSDDEGEATPTQPLAPPHLG